MPLFEFICTDCGTPFEELLRSASAASEVICPVCQGRQVRKKISTFASKAAGGGGFSLDSSASSCSTGT